MNTIKNEFNYCSTVLILGGSNPRSRDYSIYCLDTFRKHKNLKVTENSGLDLDNHLEIIRFVPIRNNLILQTSNTLMTSKVNTVVTIYDRNNKLQISDPLFTSEEYNKLESNENILFNKVKSLGLLVEAFCTKNFSNMPLFIKEYSKISKIFFDHPEYWSG